MSGMPSSRDAYLELNGPKDMVFNDMMMQCASFHSEATPPKSKCHTNSSKPILPGKGNAKRTPQYKVCGVISQSTR